jgi:cold shock CspA family protein
VSGIPPPPDESAGMRAAMGSPAVLALLEDDVRLQGLVKGYNMAGGFGFIRCTKTWEIFGCDVFLHKFEAEAAGATASGACVTFGLRLGKEGKPQAVAVAMVAPAGAQKNAPNGRVYSGMIKSFNQEKGFGFISCEALQDAFGRDAFLHVNQKGDFFTGDRVNFQIDIDAKGFPKARDLTEATGYGGEVEAGAGLPRKATRRTVSPGGTERVKGNPRLKPPPLLTWPAVCLELLRPSSRPCQR